MKLLIATIAVVLAFSALASAQTVSNTKPLAEVAKSEEARRKGVKKPAKVYTNSSLKADPNGASTPAPTSGTPAASGGSQADPVPAEEEVEAGGPKTQEYWQKRMTTARGDLERAKLFAESLQSRINSLTADAANRDYPQRGVLEQQRNTSLAELDRVKKQIDDGTKAIAAIQDEARRAGVPAGWVR